MGSKIQTWFKAEEEGRRGIWRKMSNLRRQRSITKHTWASGWAREVIHPKFGTTQILEAFCEHVQGRTTHYYSLHTTRNRNKLERGGRGRIQNKVQVTLEYFVRVNSMKIIKRLTELSWVSVTKLLMDWIVANWPPNTFTVHYKTVSNV